MRILKKTLLVVTIFARARNLNSKEQINFIANRKKNYRKELAKQDHHPVLTWTTFMTTMRLRGREAIMSRREPIVNSREQIPGPSSQTAKGGKADEELHFVFVSIANYICHRNAQSRAEMKLRILYRREVMSFIWKPLEISEVLPSWIIEEQWVELEFAPVLHRLGLVQPALEEKGKANLITHAFEWIFLGVKNWNV